MQHRTCSKTCSSNKAVKQKVTEQVILTANKMKLIHTYIYMYSNMEKQNINKNETRSTLVHAPQSYLSARAPQNIQSENSKSRNLLSQEWLRPYFNLRQGFHTITAVQLL